MLNARLFVFFKMLEFNQTEFFNGGSPGQYSMDSTGYVYVPTQCREGAGKAEP